jgi:hypothetical protein
MFGLFGPHVPRTLNTDADFAELDKVLGTTSARKIRKALALVEASGTSARRAAPRILPFLDQPQLSIHAARALWSIERNPRAVDVIKGVLNKPIEPKERENEFLVELLVDAKGEALKALSQMAKDDSVHLQSLEECTQPFLDMMASGKGSGDMVEKVFNVFTGGDDNKAARHSAAFVAEIAWVHETVRRKLASIISKPQNEQQKRYAALALGFASQKDGKKMREQLSFMNTFFDHPDIATSAGRNKIRDDNTAMGLAVAKAIEEEK